MRSGTSFFDLTVWKKTVLRFWPIWAAGLVFWGLLLPVRGLRILQVQVLYGDDQMRQFAASVGEMGGDPALAFSVIFGLLAAMAACSHLYSSRSANFMGALPVRREGLFLSHYAAGLSMLVLPNVAVFLLMALVEALGGGVEWTPLLFWLGALSGTELFFYSFAVCLGMFTGHLLAQPIFYGIFNFLAVAVLYLWEQTMVEFYFGYAGNHWLSGIAGWLTPVLCLADSVDCFASIGSVSYGAGAGYTVEDITSYEMRGLDIVGIYALAGLVLAVCALLLYRRRDLETAGDVVAVRAMRPVFQYGVAICAGLFFGTFTALVLGLDSGRMAAMVVWAVVGFFVARMLLDKTFRVFRRWKGAAAVTAVFIALFLVVGFDLTGYESRVPDPAQVASVEVTGLYNMPGDDGSFWNGVVVEDQGEIALVTQLHQAVVDHRDTPRGGDDEAVSLNLVYTMENGTVMTRRYDYGQVICRREDAGRPGTVAWAVEQLLADRDLVWQSYGLDAAQRLLDEGGRVMNADYRWDGGLSGQTEVPADLPATVAEPTQDQLDQTDWSFHGDDAQALWEAMVQDFQDGAIGVRDLWGDAGGSSLTRSILFTVAGKEINLSDPAALNEVIISIAVPDTAARTLAALAALGAQV